MMKRCLLLLLTSSAAGQVLFPDEVTAGFKSTTERFSVTGFPIIPDLPTPENFAIPDLPTPENSSPPREVSSNACVTSDRERGICGPISDCPSYSQLLTQTAERNTTEFLRSRICRITAAGVDYCCTLTANLPSILPAEDSCGLPTRKKVAGDFETKIGNWPWLAAVGHPLPANGFSNLCGGTIITKRHVLTAGHCFEPHAFTEIITHVRLGEHHLTSTTDGLFPQDIRIAFTKLNSYKLLTKENDIAILVLERDAVFNDFVSPACLPIVRTLRSSSFNGERATVVGWGVSGFEPDAQLSQVPLHAEIPISPFDECVKVYTEKTTSVIDGRNICAGNEYADACRGDSGGPLNYLNPLNGRYYVIGIVSHGVGCAMQEFPGVYTRVGAFMDWILSSI